MLKKSVLIPLIERLSLIASARCIMPLLQDIIIEKLK